jgi:Fic family protein
VKSFAPGFLERLPLTQGMLRAVRLLGEFKGRQDLYKQQIPQALETLRQAAVIQSTEASNRIEGVTAPLKRIQALVAEKTEPRNRSEQEIAGYRDVLNTIHSNYSDIPFNTGIVLQFHRDLYRYAAGEGGKWKPADNTIEEVRPDGERVVRFRPVAAHATPEYMERLHADFRQVWETGEVERLLLIAAYVLDFLCVHPFHDGNGRMARLLTLLLLYHAGYEVGRYVSLERVVEQSRESYYETLQRSSAGWHDGKHDLIPWIEYFLGVVTAAYKEFEERAGKLTAARGAKTEMVLGTIGAIRGDFSVKDLQQRCPHVGIDLLRKILRGERKAGRVECLGKGPDARWRRLGM